MDQIPEWFPGSRLNYAENLLRYFGSDFRHWVWFGVVLVGVKGDKVLYLFQIHHPFLFFKIISVFSS
jgi:hypothetical protein